MEYIKNINELITISRYKNGSIRLSHHRINQTNIYQVIRDLGYRKSTINRKRVYYQRNNDGTISVSHYRGIVYAFHGYLRNTRFTNVPDDLTYSDIINWFYRGNYIKQKGIDHYLNEMLSDSDVHEYFMQSDHEYRHRFKVERALLHFKDWGFSSTIDNTGLVAHKGAKLYYKLLIDERFLIFAHHEATKKKHNDVFDGWLASFKEEKHIGDKRPVDLMPVFWDPIEDEGLETIKEFITI